MELKRLKKDLIKGLSRASKQSDIYDLVVAEDLYTTYIDCINDAHIFHVGNGNDIAKMFGGIYPSKAFCDDFKMRLPYQECLFVVTEDNTDLTTYILTYRARKGVDDVFGFLAFIGGEKEFKGRIALVPMFGLVSMDKPLGESTALSDFFKTYAPNEALNSKYMKSSHICTLPMSTFRATYNGDVGANGMLESFVDTFQKYGAIVEKILILLNTRGIEVKTVKEVARKIKFKKRFKREYFEYKVLSVSRSDQKKTSESVPQGLWKNSLHFTRGHIRIYTKDKPMFGKKNGYVGSVWVPPHIRGNKRVGVIQKDYSMQLALGIT